MSDHQEYNGFSTGLTLLGMMVIFGVFLLTQNLVFLMLSLLAGAESISQIMGGPHSGDLLMISSIMAALLGTATVWIFLKFKKLSFGDYLGFKSFKISQLIIWALIYLAFLVLLYLFRDFFQEEVYFVEEMLRGVNYLPLLYLSVVVGAPLFEEIFLRGFAYKGLKEGILGAGGAITITALIFALLHAMQYGPYYLIAIFAGGLIMGMARHYSGSLWVPIILHGLHNLISIIYIFEPQ